MYAFNHLALVATTITTVSVQNSVQQTEMPIRLANMASQNRKYESSTTAPVIVLVIWLKTEPPDMTGIKFQRLSHHFQDRGFQIKPEVRIHRWRTKTVIRNMSAGRHASKKYQRRPITPIFGNSCDTEERNRNRQIQYGGSQHHVYGVASGLDFAIL